MVAPFPVLWTPLHIKTLAFQNASLAGSQEVTAHIFIEERRIVLLCPIVILLCPHVVHMHATHRRCRRLPPGIPLDPHWFFFCLSPQIEKLFLPAAVGRQRTFHFSGKERWMDGWLLLLQSSQSEFIDSKFRSFSVKAKSQGATQALRSEWTPAL